MKSKRDDVISKMLLLIGAAVFVYGLVLCIMMNLNLGVVLVVLLGILCLCSGLFYRQLKQLTSAGFFKYCKILLVVGLCMEIALVSFIAVFGFNDNVSYSEDAVIVLGAGIRGERVTLPLKMRLDKAVAYHLKNPEAYIVVTGGQGLQETVTEAYAMEKYLLENGVPADRIIKEERATSTYENMKFSKELLDARFAAPYSAVIITNHFHIYRGTAIARKAGLSSVSHLYAGLQWYNIMPCYLRESLAVLKMWIIG